MASYLGITSSLIAANIQETPKASETQVTSATVPLFELRSEPVATAPEVIESPQVAPEVTEGPSTQVVEPQAPALIPVRLTDEMRAAGIPDADFQTVTTLLLTADGWIAPGTSYGVYLAAGAFDPTERFKRAHKWVQTSYGTWTGAMTRYETNGGNW